MTFKRSVPPVKLAANNANILFMGRLIPEIEPLRKHGVLPGKIKTALAINRKEHKERIERNW